MAYDPNVGFYNDGLRSDADVIRDIEAMTAERPVDAAYGPIETTGDRMSVDQMTDDERASFEWAHRVFATYGIEHVYSCPVTIPGPPHLEALADALAKARTAADEARQEAIDLADMMDAGLPVDAWDGQAW